ncbi:TPA: DoxX family protein [Klebsiella aerogenes]|nr:DoxX family protein [Klebsiella aerogenes]HBT2500606.1 DoxX family protein [Klebsiella aerogenes]
MISIQALTQRARQVLGCSSVLWLGYLGLCAAYLQGGINKLMDFQGAIAEMNYFGFAPAPLFAVLVIVLELGASAMILFGFLRWLAALALAGFTLVATFITLRFWELPDGMERFSAANSFFEHLGLVGGFILIAWLDVMRSNIRAS